MKNIIHEWVIKLHLKSKARQNDIARKRYEDFEQENSRN